MSFGRARGPNGVRLEGSFRMLLDFGYANPAYAASKMSVGLETGLDEACPPPSEVAIGIITSFVAHRE